MGRYCHRKFSWPDAEELKVLSFGHFWSNEKYLERQVSYFLGRLETPKASIYCLKNRAQTAFQVWTFSIRRGFLPAGWWSRWLNSCWIRWTARWTKDNTMKTMKKAGFSSGYLLGFILHIFWGDYFINHYNDPYSTTSIMESKRFFFSWHICSSLWVISPARLVSGKNRGTVM